MSAENLFEQLSYLETAIASVEEALIDKENEIIDLSLKLANAEMAVVNAQKESEDFANRINRDAQKYIESEVHARVESTLAAERQTMKDELEKARNQLATAKNNTKRNTPEPQIDLFGQTWGSPAPSHRVANDQSALILAGKLDSTIDKVQRLIREAGA